MDADPYETTAQRLLGLYARLKILRLRHPREYRDSMCQIVERTPAAQLTGMLVWAEYLAERAPGPVLRRAAREFASDLRVFADSKLGGQENARQ